MTFPTAPCSSEVVLDPDLKIIRDVASAGWK